MNIISASEKNDYQLTAYNYLNKHPKQDHQEKKYSS